MRRQSNLRKDIKINLLLLTLIASLFFLIVFLNRQDQVQAPVVANSREATETIRTIAKNIFEHCRLQQGSTCYETAVSAELLANYSTEQILSAIYDFDTYFSCHAFSHFVGRTLYYKLQNIADAYSQVDFTCHGGAYHGVIEAFLDQRKLKIDQIDGGQIQTICSDSKNKINKNQKQVQTECLHGFGHAFMFITEADLPLSLHYCDKLAAIDREICYGGVFMENSTSSTNPDHPSVWIKADDKYYPCTILERQYQSQCYFYQANYWVKLSSHDYLNVFKDCESLSGGFRSQCLLGLGASLAGFSRNVGINQLAEICALGQDDAAYICLEGAVPSILDRYGGETDHALLFCQTAPSSLKELCFVKIGYTAHRWGKTEKAMADICQWAGVFEQACLGNSKFVPKY